MKMLRLLILMLLVYGVTASAQTTGIPELMAMKPHSVAKIKVDTNTAVYLPMPFARASFFNLSQQSKITSVGGIYAIELVYTRYKESDTFSQPILNEKRFKELQKLLPAVFQQKDIVWNVVEQTGARNRTDASKYYHGFVIYMKNEPDKKAVEKDISVISSILDSYSDSLVWVPEKLVWKVKRRKAETGRYIPVLEKKKDAGITYDKKGIFGRKPEVEIDYDSTLIKKTGGYYNKVGKFNTAYFKTTSEFNMLAKRKWSDKVAVVTDVTGSMSPYSTQVMLWIKYNPKALESGRFTFFNDGNNTPDAFKKIGNTGGIYFAKDKNFDSVLQTMLTAMRNGLGGDWPENNLEAVIKTIQKWPDTDTVLMIADNDAAVKDLVLLDKIKTPISVLLCGVTDRVHPDYIKITKATGGHLFILETDLNNIKGLKNGQKILIGGKYFEFRNGGLFLR